MRYLLFVCFLLSVVLTRAQGIFREDRFSNQEKYISFNPFGLAEPHLAIGAGFGNRFTDRSEYFAELCYVLKHPFYDNNLQNQLHGFRFIGQYRYHFLQRWRPIINLGSAIRIRNASRNPFIGLEFRIKPFNFSANRTFVNNNSVDTLADFLYKANAVSIGGALIFGETYNISSNGKWKLEFSVGIGGKIKFVKYKNIPAGYKPILLDRHFGLATPGIDEPIGTPNFPCALRVRYMID